MALNIMFCMQTENKTTKTPIQSAIKIRIQIWLVRLSFAKFNSQECLGKHENISIIAIVLKSSHYSC